MKKTTILGVETSCDETALSLVEAEGTLASRPRFTILKNLVASQIEVHREFGGVVPNLAKREHLKNLPILFRQIFGNYKSQKTNNKLLHDIGCVLRDVDLIAVTVGPGLEPALWTGINFAKELAKKYKKPLLGVNHLEGHLYSFLLPQKKRLASKIFPAIALIVSGGHTLLLLVKDLKTWKIIGETRDDAAGEAFDKVARMLKLPYPGGPEIQRIAVKGKSDAINFPRPMIYDNSPAGEYDFSFSGLKTSVLYYLQNHKRVKKADVAASFQEAAIDVLVKKAGRAAKECSAKSILLSGGVAANKKLRRDMRHEISKLNRDKRHETRKMGIQFLVADQKYNTDNAVMIAAAGYMAYLRKKKYPLRANGNLGI